MVPRVVKLGGAPLDDPRSREAFARAIAAGRGMPTVIVHGGGALIDDYQRRLGIPVRKVHGLRATDDDGMAAVEMVLSGLCNKRLVAALLAAGVDALGLSGVDRGLLRCRAKRVEGEDLGWVGSVTAVRREVLDSLLALGVTPVISPVSLGETDHRPYNVNADQAAAAIALALGASELCFVSDVPGVRLAGDDVAAELTRDQVEAAIADGTIHGGMVIKVRAALDALGEGLVAVRIANVAGLALGGGTVLTSAGAASKGR